MTARARLHASIGIMSAALFIIFSGCSRTGNNNSQDDAPTQKGQVQATTTSLPKVAAAAESIVPFLQAVRLEPPDDELRPPDMTAAGKVTAKLYEQIAGREGAPGLWEQAKFTSADGKPLTHFALVKTDAGDFKIELFHEAAPNHVRSFICLARAGYFDGLPFHASIRRGEKEAFHGYLESGCPKGTGEIGYGSIGYWLKPEISDKLRHEEGSVGAWHPGDVERAACRFYITLNRYPAFDSHYTIFGKVVHGLDVAHTINKRPMQDEESKGPTLKPYRIRQVIIQQAAG